MHIPNPFSRLRKRGAKRRAGRIERRGHDMSSRIDRGVDQAMGAAYNVGKERRP